MRKLPISGGAWYFCIPPKITNYHFPNLLIYTNNSFTTPDKQCQVNIYVNYGNSLLYNSICDNYYYYDCVGVSTYALMN